MKLYTKRGDDGKTELIGGRRVSKNHPRVVAYGCVDELNAALGLALADCQIDAIAQPLITAQGMLFSLGAELASPDSAHPQSGRIRADHVAEIEQHIDLADESIPPLRNFILPGGTALAARLHLARTICRRAERGVVALADGEGVDPVLIAYLNRLADLLFALARLANANAGIEDVPWKGDA